MSKIIDCIVPVIKNTASLCYGYCGESGSGVKVRGEQQPYQNSLEYGR